MRDLTPLYGAVVLALACAQAQAMSLTDAIQGTLDNPPENQGSDNKPLLILPCMIATVDIIADENSVMDYVLKPILKAPTEATRER